MNGNVHLLLPLASSLIYVFGALWLRRAGDLGVGVWRATFISNGISACLFAPLAVLGGPGQPLHLLIQPALLACLLVTGQALAFVSLTRADVTISTPVLGIKPVLVAALSTILLKIEVTWNGWVAAALSSVAIALLSRKGAGRPRHVTLGVVTALAAAADFALFDVLVQKWTPAWGAGRFLPLVMAMGAVVSLGFLPFFRAPLLAIPRPAWRPLLAGATAIAVQGVMLITSVAVFGDATSVNILYALRSLWMVIIVWAVGHWFHNPEGRLGARVLGWRLAGASLMTAAVCLVVIGGRA